MKNVIDNNFFINNNYIKNVIKKSKDVSDDEINKILDKAENLDGLSHIEIAPLISTKNKKHIERIYKIANKIKKEIYGDRIVIFAPIYISNYCINTCEYCGYKFENKFPRNKLSKEELMEEVKILEEMGHKRLALEAGEDPKNCSIDYILECINTIYSMKTKNGEIRRLNINIAATTKENYKKLSEANIGTYILFQETYHKESYEKNHIKGPKKDYYYHTTAFDRAMESGIDDVGGGVLFGLYDPIYEIIGLMIHNEHLEKTYGVGFHTISMPRLCQAEGMDKNNYKYLLDDELYKQLVAVMRIAIPFAGIIISTRESVEMRKILIDLGVSQISAGSSVEVNGYKNNKKETKKQFEVSDHRSAHEIINWLIDDEFIPSFCTACYRSGRTGDRFMQLAKTGNIKNVCLPNALITLKEYSLDYGNEDLKNKVEYLINKNIKKIENETIRNETIKRLNLLETGKRDMYL